MAEARSSPADPQRALIEDAIAALNEGFADPAYDVEGTVERIFHPEAELAPRYVAPEEPGFRGPAGATEFIGELRRLFEGFELRLEDVLGDGDTRVAVYTVIARMRDAEVDVHQRLAAEFRIRDGKLVWMQVYDDRAEALRAAGLDPA